MALGFLVSFAFFSLRCEGVAMLQHGADPVLEDAGDILASAEIVQLPEDPTPTRVQEVLLGLASLPHPTQKAVPAVQVVVCDRDYGANCPMGFVLIDSLCYPEEAYAGPCDHTSPSNMSRSAKKRFEVLCTSLSLECKAVCMQRHMALSRLFVSH
jgi:hypothetical protein